MKRVLNAVLAVLTAAAIVRGATYRQHHEPDVQPPAVQRTVTSGYVATTVTDYR